MSKLLEIIDEHLGTAPPSPTSDAPPSQLSRRIVRIPAGFIRRDLLRFGVFADDAVDEAGRAATAGLWPAELEVWIVDDALGPRVVLVVSEPEGVAHELVVGADGTVRP